MKPEIFSELRKLRNQIAHGVQHADPTALTHSFAQLGLSVPTANIPSLTQAILNVFGGHGAFYHVPPVLLQVLSKLLEGRSIGVACDPWAGIGEVISVVCGSTHAPKAFAFTLNESELTLGRALVSEVEWKLGPPLQSLDSLTGGLDLVRTAQGKLYLLVAIDRTSKFVFVEILISTRQRTALGQSRHSAGAPMTSGLPR